MKVVLIVFSFLFVSFLGAEEPASVQTQPAEESAKSAEAGQESNAQPASEPQQQAAAEAQNEAPAADDSAKPAESLTAQQSAASDEPTVKQEEKPLANSVDVQDEQGYDLKLRNLEEKINTLKDKIFRSKQKLAVLQESVITGAVAGSSVSILHKNAVGSMFRLDSAVFYLDDNEVFKQEDSPEGLETPDIKIYEGSVAPGSHNLSVFYVFKGKGYGLFSYLKEYTFKLNKDCPFSVEEGSMVEITSSAADKGGGYNFKNRLYVTCDVNKKRFDSPEGGLDDTEQVNLADAAEQGLTIPANADSAITITQKNTVGTMFKQISASYSLDNATVYKQLDSPETFESETISVYEGAIVSGHHNVKAECVFKGNGYGLFSYMKDYVFTVSENYSFDADKNTQVDIIAVLKDKGASHNVDNRLNISFSSAQKKLNSPKQEDETKATAREE